MEQEESSDLFSPRFRRFYQVWAFLLRCLLRRHFSAGHQIPGGSRNLFWDSRLGIVLRKTIWLITSEDRIGDQT